MKHTLLFLACTFVFLALTLLSPASAVAQVGHLSRNQQKKQVRNSLKEAKKVTSDYNESHLNVHAYNFRNGESGRKLKKLKKKEEMPIKEDGTAVVKPRIFPKRGAPGRARKN